MTGRDGEGCDKVSQDRRQTPTDDNAAGSATRGASGEQDGERSTGGLIYQIRIKGHLDSRWSKWFEDLGMVHEPDGTTVLTGPLADQPALHGLLIKIRDLGLPLLSVNALSPDERGRGGPNGVCGCQPASGRREEP